MRESWLSKEVHGGVESGVSVDEKVHQGITQQGSNEDHEHQRKQESIVLCVVKEFQKNEVHLCGVIGILHGCDQT